MTLAAWVAAGNYVSIAVSFVVFIILARYLSPTEFGIVAVATVFLDVLQIVARGGLPDVIVQKHDLTEEYADTAFWVSNGIGVLSCLALLAFSYPISLAFKMPELAAVLAALSIVFVIGGLGAIHEGRLTRTFGFKSLSLRGLVANVVSGAVAVWLAFAGYGVWSLVTQRLLSSFAILIVTWIAYPWMPGFRFNRTYAKEQLAFGSNVFGTNLLLALNNRVHELIAALFLTAADVGYLRVAWRCIDLIAQFAVIPLASVALPTYSRLQHDHERLEHSYIHFLIISSTITYPALLGMAAVAPIFLFTIFGEQWRPAAPVLQILCLLAPPLVTNSFMWPMLVAANKTRYGLIFTILQFVLGSVLSFVAAPFGVIYIALSHLVRAYGVWPIGLWIMAKSVGISAAATLRAVGTPLAAAAAMAGAVMLVQTLLPTRLDHKLSLAILIASGCGAYLICTALLSPGIFRLVRSELIPYINQRLRQK